MRSTLADLLRRHGAVDDLPRPNRIEVRRPSTGYLGTIALTKGTNDWSQVTVLELLALQYGFLSASPNWAGRDGYQASAFFNAAFSQSSRLGFPDLAHLRIRRPAPELKSWKEQVVDLRPVFESGDCSKDVRLEWGDVVDIPETDHSLNEKWDGFSTTELANLRKCLTRKVEIVINGQATNISLAPQISNVGEGKEAAVAAAAASRGCHSTSACVPAGAVHHCPHGLLAQAGPPPVQAGADFLRPFPRQGHSPTTRPAGRCASG